MYYGNALQAAAAVYGGSEAVVKLLLDRGADVFEKDLLNFLNKYWLTLKAASSLGGSMDFETETRPCHVGNRISLTGTPF